MGKALGNSPLVYLLNTLCVMACLASIMFISMHPGIDSSVLAVVSGTAGTIAGSLITIMLKSTGSDEQKEDPMVKVAMKLLDRLDEDITIKGTQVNIKRGDSEMDFNESNV